MTGGTAEWSSPPEGLPGQGPHGIQVAGEEIGLPRIVTYNVHHCLGGDGRLSPRRIAAVIASCRPDIVALQELDVGRARSGHIDQAHAIAQELGMHMHFHPAMRVMEELYGNAIMTAQPSRFVKAGALPGLARNPGLEPRGALWAAADVGGTELQLINTHLGLGRRERLRQVEALLGPEWLGHSGCRDPVILLGDFNAVPGSRAYERIAQRLRDAQRAYISPASRPQPTFPTRLPLLRIDHIFVSRSIEVLGVEIPRTAAARIASDHLPLVVEFQVRSRATNRCVTNEPCSCACGAAPMRGAEDQRGSREPGSHMAAKPRRTSRTPGASEP